MRSLVFTVLLLAFLASQVVGCNRKSSAVTEPAANHGVQHGNNDLEPTENKRLGTFTVGKATTFVTGPIEADGHIDYASALNERLREGVTTENNAVVLFLKILGPRPDGANIQPQFFDMLGVQIPTQGDYFIPYLEFREKQSNGIPTDPNGWRDEIRRLARRTWTPNEHPQVDSWLKANEGPLALLLEASKQTRYYLPLIPPRNNRGSTGLINSPLPSVMAVRELANALLVRATLEIGLKHPDAAWRDLLACHRLSRLIGRGATIIESLVGAAIEQMTFDSDLAFIDTIQPDVKWVEACLRDLRSLPPAAMARSESPFAKYEWPLWP